MRSRKWALSQNSRGYKYIPTSICYFSQYPDTLSLKKVDDISVAEAMLEIFSRTVLPDEIHTDLGSVFVGITSNR